MADWNPNEPSVEGMEWMPTRYGGTVLDSDGKAAIMRVHSTAAETIARANFNVAQVITPGNYLIEMYTAGNEVCGAVTTDTYRPNEDTGTTNFETQVGATINLWSVIDDPVLDVTDYIVNRNPPLEASYTFKLNTAAWPANRRVLDLRFFVVGQQMQEQQQWNLELRKQGAGFLTVWSQNIASVSPLFTRRISVGGLNPFTGLPWTQTEIQSFDSIIDPNRLSATLRMRNFVGGQPRAHIFQVWMEVDWVVENRLAVGRGVVQIPGWSSFALQNPSSGVANWAKAAATDYSMLIRRVAAVGSPGASSGGPLGASTGNAQWGHLNSYVDLPWGGFTEYPILDANGCVIDADGSGRDTKGHGFVLRTTAPATSPDGQPYDTVPTANVQAGIIARQQVTPTVNSSGEAVRFLVGIADDVPPTADLLVKIKDDGSGLQIGGTGTLTLAQLLTLPVVDGFRTPIVPLAAAAALVAGTKYRVEWTSASAGPFGWPVAYGESVFNFGAASFNGVADAGDPGTGVYDPDIDFLAQILDLPAALAGFTLTPSSQALPGDGTNCSVNALRYAHLDWTTSVAAGFQYYEVERSSDGGATWDIIARITAAASSEFDDYEAPRNVQSCYRARQFVTPALVPSPYTATLCFTPASEGCEYLFVSNVDPSLNVGYNDTYTGDQSERRYQFLDADRVKIYPIFGRDRQVAFQPTERLGDEFNIPVLINFINTPVPEGRRLFDAIFELSRAELPYVAVLDSDGNVWYSVLRVPEGSRLEPGKMYVAPVTVTEVAVDPWVVLLP